MDARKLGLNSSVNSWRHGTPVVIRALILLPVLFGSGYLVLQIKALGQVRDSAFVGLLLGATYLLVYGMRLTNAYVRRGARNFFALLGDADIADEAASRARQFEVETFSDRLMVLGGITYALVIATTAVVILGSWPGQPSLAVGLWLFLFSVNYVTGMGFTGLALLFRAMWRARDCLVLTIWRRSNESTRFIDDLRIRSASLAAAYIGLSLTSIIFSVIPMGSLIAAYSLFSAAVILAALSVPGLVIRSRLEEERGEAMTKLDRELQHEFQSLLESVADMEAHLTRIDGLLKIRDKIEGLAPPPITWRSLRTGVGVLVMTGLPVLIEQLIGLAS